MFFQMQRSSLTEPFRYLERVHKARRIFSRETWKDVSAQKWDFLKIFQTYFDLDFFLIFWLNFFECLQNILCGLYEHVKDIQVLGLVFSFASGKKLWLSDYIPGKVKRVEIWQNSSWNILIKFMFWAENFFKDFQTFFCGLCEHFQGMCMPSWNISSLQ